MPPADKAVELAKRAEADGYDSIGWPSHLMGWHPESVWTEDITPLAKFQPNPHTYFDPLVMMPVVGALVAGFGLQTAKFMVAGISEIAPVAGMFVFAILFFGIMTDAGLLEPLLRRITRLAGSRPSLIVPATALLALLVLQAALEQWEQWALLLLGY